jgi:hypothetical protein
MVCRLKNVGWIFAQPGEDNDVTVSSEELSQMAEVQRTVGMTAVTLLVVQVYDEFDEFETPDVIFEAFQVMLLV